METYEIRKHYSFSEMEHFGKYNLSIEAHVKRSMMKEMTETIWQIDNFPYWRYIHEFTGFCNLESKNCTLILEYSQKADFILYGGKNER